jgi:hypothetical protein
MNFQPITLTLGSDTLGVYVPDARNGNIFSFAEQGATSLATTGTLTSSITKPTKSQKLYQVRFRMFDNVSKTVLDADGNQSETGVLDYEDSVDVVFKFDARSDQNRRQLLMKKFMAFLSSETAGSQVVQLQSLY